MNKENQNNQEEPNIEKVIIGCKFALGQLVATRGVHAYLDEHNINILPYIASHVSGDWGEVCEDDAKSNEDALVNGDRIMSVYTLRTTEKIWIITEADRRATTVLFPHEY